MKHFRHIMPQTFLFYRFTRRYWRPLLLQALLACLLAVGVAVGMAGAWGVWTFTR